METKELTENQIKMLRAPLPQEAVSKHPTKTYLSSIKAIYVVERLNQVFGIGKWELLSEIIDNKTSMIVVKAKLVIAEYNIRLESFGGNDNGGENSKNFDLGDAYKGATTDALTKICSFLEIGMSVFKGQGNKPADLPKKEEPKKEEPKKQAPEEKKPFTIDDPKFDIMHKNISEGFYSIEELEKIRTVAEPVKKVLLSRYGK